MVLKKNILFFLFFFILYSSFVSSEYWSDLTIGQGDIRYCRQGFNCVLGDLDIFGNVSIIGQVFNVTMTMVNYTITDSFNIEGGIYAGTYCDINTGLCYSMANLNATTVDTNLSEGGHMSGNLSIEMPVNGGDAGLVVQSDINKHSYLKLREGSSLGFNFWYDGSGDNYFSIDSVNADYVIDTRFRIERNSGQADFLTNVSLQDHNLIDTYCIHFTDDTWQCSASNGTSISANISAIYGDLDNLAPLNWTIVSSNISNNTGVGSYTDSSNVSNNTFQLANQSNYMISLANETDTNCNLTGSCPTSLYYQRINNTGDFNTSGTIAGTSIDIRHTDLRMLIENGILVIEG